jgi:hypothetical protein
MSVQWTSEVDSADVVQRYAAILERELAAAQAKSNLWDAKLYLYEKGEVLGVLLFPPDADLWHRFRWRYLATVLQARSPGENGSPAAPVPAA